MFDQIRSNIWKSYFLIVVFIVLVGILAYGLAAFTHRSYIFPIAVIVAVVGCIGSFYNSDKIVLSMSKARPATREENAFLINSVEGLAIAAGVPVPKIYVIDDTAPNAFATGRDPKHAVLCVTTGLMQKLDRLELEGVVAHEMSHIMGYDIRMMALVTVLAGTLVLLSDWFRTSMWWGGFGGNDDDDNRQGANPILMAIAIVVAILAPMIAMFIQLAVSRQREFLADAEGARLTRYPDGLADALQKIALDPEPLEAANKATAHLYISNPLKQHGGIVNSLFSTHPPTEERIKRLRAM